MAIDVGDILRVKFFYSQSGNQALMIGNWRVEARIPDITETAMAWAIAETWGENVLLPLLHGTAELQRVEVTHEFVNMDYGVADFYGAGVAAGDPAPPFAAIQVRQTLGTRLVRAGQKRLPFISEGHINGNELSISAELRTPLEAMFGAPTEVEWFDPIEAETWTATLQPMVVGVTWNPLGTPPGYVKDLSKAFPVQTAVAVKPTTQNSRKY